jgi:hypothetical protein
MTGREVFEALDPCRRMTARERREYQGYRTNDFTVWTVGGDVIEVLRWSENLRLPDFPTENMIRWFAAHLGLDFTLPYLELLLEVYGEDARRGRCRGCGVSRRGPVDFHLCDRCLIGDTVRQVRHRAMRELAEESRRRQERETAGFISRLPAGRRQMIEQSGVAFASPADVYADSHGEW